MLVVFIFGSLFKYQSLDPLIAFALSLEVLDLLLGFIFRNSVRVLETAGEFFALTGNLVDLVVRQPAPLFANLALELLPVAFDAVPIHGVTWLEKSEIIFARRNVPTWEIGRCRSNHRTPETRKSVGKNEFARWFALIAT